jgi:hypothetical protein
MTAMGMFLEWLFGRSPQARRRTRPPRLPVAAEVLEARVLLSTFYVSPGGSDSNNGTSPGSAWQSIGKVNAAVLSAGDQVLFEGGRSFSGSIYFGPGEGGTAGSPITLGSYGTGRATIAPSSGQDGFFAYNTAGFEITGLNFVGSGATTSTKSGIGFYNDLAGNVKLQYVHIDQVDVGGFRNGVLIGGWNGGSGYNDVRITYVGAHDNLEAGVSMYGYPLTTGSTNHAHTNVYVGHVSAWNNFGDPNSGRPSGNGIVLGGVDGAVIERSVAHDNGKNNRTNAGPVGIWAYDANDVVIQYNESYRNQTAGTGDGDGYDLDIHVTNSVLQYNYAHDNDGAGFLVYADATHPNSNNVVRYNISENDGKKLSGYGGIVVGGSVSNIDVYGNTVYVSSAASDPAAFRMTTWDGTPQNVRVRNNIFYTHQGSTGTVKLVDSTNNSTYLFQGNDYYNDSGTFAIRWGTTTYTSLSAWLAAAPTQERVGSTIVAKNVNPLLTSPGGGGTIGDADLLETALAAYRLQAGSPLIGAGLNLSALFGIDPGSRDFYGTTIPQDGAYDVGAHEFTAASPGPTPTVAVPAAASPSPVAGTTTNLSVLGADDGGEANLTYTWSLVGTPPAPVAFSANGTNASKNTVATFAKAGSYSFQVVIRDLDGRTTTSTVGVTVNQTLTTIQVTPASATVQRRKSAQFTATGYDQFGTVLTTQPTFTWTVLSGGGSIDSTGRYKAPNKSGKAVVRASSGAVSGTADVTIV